MFAELLGESSKFVMLVRKLQFRLSVGGAAMSCLVVSSSEDPVGKSSFSVPHHTVNGCFHKKQILVFD